MPERDELDQIARAIERLLRLNASRKVHASRGEAAGVRVSQPGWVLLRRIVEHGPLSLGALAEAAHMDPAATGRQIRQLEGDGLVVRTTSSEDGRVTLVVATDAGADAHRAVRQVGTRHLQDALHDWDAGDRATFAALLQRFVDDLQPVRFREPDGPRAD